MIWAALAGSSCAASVAVPARECGAVKWGPESGPVTWVSMDAARHLELRLGEASVPVAGTVTRDDDGAIFRPTFPLERGLRYTVRSDSGCEESILVPRAPASSTPPRVVDIYPRADTLPENILRFYVYFAQPMAEGGFLEHVKLTHLDSGRDLSGVFFDNMYELWSTDRKRITLLVDPGRVKTGLKAHNQRGRAFRAGQTYALSIGGGWPTLDGRTLEQARTKVFRASAAEMAPVDPDDWTLRGPKPGSRSALRVGFRKAVDHVSVGRFLSVRSPEGRQLRGRWHLERNEREASWTPLHPWPDSVADHVLVVGARFEDVAGNDVHAAFEHPVGAIASGAERRAVRVRFGERSQSFPGEGE